MSKSIFDENVFQGISDNNDRMLHTSEKSDNVTIFSKGCRSVVFHGMCCKCQNQPLMTIFSKGCRSVTIHIKKGDTLQASYSHSLNLRIIVTFPQLVIKVSWQQFLKVHFCPADGSKGWQRDAHGNPLASHLQHQPCLSRFARDEGAQHQLGGRLDHLSVFWCSIHDKNTIWDGGSTAP